MENLDQDQPQPAAPPRRSWLARNWRWFVPVTLLGLVLLCGGCCVGIFGVVFGVLKSSEPYQMALERVQKDPQVIAQLGEPIEDADWFPSGEINVQNDQGRARFDFDVAGPNGKAHVHAEVRRLAGQWGLTRVVVTTEDRKRIVLDVTSGEGPNQAPLFQP